MSDTIELTIRRDHNYLIAFEPKPEGPVEAYATAGSDVLRALKGFFERQDADNDLAAEVVRLTRIVEEQQHERDLSEQNAQLIETLHNLSQCMAPQQAFTSAEVSAIARQYLDEHPATKGY